MDANDKEKETNESTKTCAIIFERHVLMEDEYQSLYVYTPMEVTTGSIVNVDDTVLFVSKNVKSLKDIENENYNEETESYEFPLMSDSTCLFDSYVFGFPIPLSEGKSNIKQIKKEVNELIKDSENCKLLHVINKDDTLNKVFLLMNNNVKVSVDVTDYYELFQLIYGQTIDLIDAVSYIKDEEKKKEEEETVKTPNYLYSDDIFNEVSKTVICQDDQIREVATAIAKNSRLTSPSLKSTILLCGPTGVGKTEIFRVIQEKNMVPVTIEDSTEYTASGYKGKDVIEMLSHLIDKANGDIEKAQRGIIVLDEVDKKVSSSGDHDIYTSAVIDSLLKMMEGHIYSVPVSKNIEVPFDTSLLTFVFLGAFSGIEEHSTKKAPMGFVTKEALEESKKITNLYNDDTLKKYGLKPEFIGRCDSIIVMNNLDVEDFIRIIKTSDKSQLLLYKYLLKDIGIDFIYDEKTIEAIALKAKELGLGARSIKKIVENAISVVSYELFTRNQYSKLIISPETIENNKAYILK